MTVIAYDGKTLAADRRVSYGSTTMSATKIERFSGELLAFSGDGSMGRELFAWYAAGADAASWPASNRSPDSGACLMVVRADGTFWRYETGPHPIQFDAPCAFGCGMEAAMVAFACGLDAARAVEMASRFNSGCGNGVDTLTL